MGRESAGLRKEIVSGKKSTDNNRFYFRTHQGEKEVREMSQSREARLSGK